MDRHATRRRLEALGRDAEARSAAGNEAEAWAHHINARTLRSLARSLPEIEPEADPGPSSAKQGTPSRIEETIEALTRRHARQVGMADLPTLAVFWTARTVHAQVIDQARGVVARACFTERLQMNGPPKAAASRLGRAIAKRALDLGVTKVALDRQMKAARGVRTVTEAARTAGLHIE